MNQFSLFGDGDIPLTKSEPIQPANWREQLRVVPYEPKNSDYDFDVGDYINYQNGQHICAGNVLDKKVEGKYHKYRVRATRDKTGSEYDGYSIQWIYEFQIIK